MPALSFDEYLEQLGPVSTHVSPLDPTAESTAIKAAADELRELPSADRDSLVQWVTGNPKDVYVLGLTVGLSHEKLKNNLRHKFGTASWNKLAGSHPQDLVDYLDEEFSLLQLLENQRGLSYNFGDVLVARAGTRGSAARAGAQGRSLEDRIEEIARGLGLGFAVRGRFKGRDHSEAPFDLAVPSAEEAQIVVAAKGFDSTGSKLTDTVREIEEMAKVRSGRQVVYAVIDGIGWKSRKADLEKVHNLWERDLIDGMYTVKTLDAFRMDLAEAARLRGLLPD
jgi:hypothetical protein